MLPFLFAASSVHAGDSVDPAKSKFYGDISERLTAASTHLLFFGLELNRVDDDVIERAMQAPELGHYRPWIEDLRKDKPYQLEDRVERYFLESMMSQLPGELAGFLVCCAILESMTPDLCTALTGDVASEIVKPSAARTSSRVRDMAHL